MFSKQVAIVADDSTQVQLIVTRILKDKLNFGRICVAANGKQALKFFESENIDWIFSDWEMPTMNGYEFLLAIRKHPRGEQIPFILMTGYSDRKTLASAMEAGVTDFISKPFSPEILVQKVRRIAAAIERRVAVRIRAQSCYHALIIFDSGASYEAIIEDISVSGCCLRTTPLQHGGTVSDQAQLTLKLESHTVIVKTTTIRIVMDCDPDKPTPDVLVAFHFQFDSEAQKAIKLFITEQQAREVDRTGKIFIK